MNLAQLLTALFAPAILRTPVGPVDARRRYWPPHRPVGTPRRARNPNADALRMTVERGRIELAERVKLAGGKGLR